MNEAILAGVSLIAFVGLNNAEDVMFRKLITGSLLAVASLSMVLAVGCAESANKPYNLTGQELTPEQQRYVDQHSIDSKGHYNSVMTQKAWNDVRLANQQQQQP
jgi:hypothetical protein